MAEQVNKADPKIRAVNRGEFGIDFLLKPLRTRKAQGQYTRGKLDARIYILRTSNICCENSVFPTTYENDGILQRKIWIPVFPGRSEKVGEVAGGAVEFG